MQIARLFCSVVLTSSQSPTHTEKEQPHILCRLLFFHPPRALQNPRSLYGGLQRVRRMPQVVANSNYFAVSGHFQMCGDLYLQKKYDTISLARRAADCGSAVKIRHLNVDKQGAISLARRAANCGLAVKIRHLNADKHGEIPLSMICLTREMGEKK